LFYQEASQAHLNASSGVSNSGSAMQPSLEAATSSEFGGGGEGGVGGEDQLLDLGHHQMSVAERAAGMSSNLSNMGASFGMGLRHAAKHKGGIGSVFLMKKTGGGGAGAQAGAAGDGGVGGGVATEQDTGASEYVRLYPLFHVLVVLNVVVCYVSLSLFSFITTSRLPVSFLPNFPLCFSQCPLRLPLLYPPSFTSNQPTNQPTNPPTHHMLAATTCPWRSSSASQSN